MGKGAMGITDGKIEVRWLDEERHILLSSWRPDWTWHEFDQRTEDTYALIRSLNAPVAMIIAVDSGAGLPSGSPLPHFQHGLQAMPPNLRHVIIIGASRFLQQIIGMMVRLFGHHESLIIFARSMAEAETIAAVATNQETIL